MNSKIVWLSILVVSVGGYLYCQRAPTLPELVLLDDDGSRFSLESMRDGKVDLVLALFGPNDPATLYAADIVREAYEKHHSAVGFAALMFSAGADARQRLAADKNLDFPLYPLNIKNAPDPYVVEKFFKQAVGTHGLIGAQVRSGTILIIDDKRRLRFALADQDAAKLPEKLAELGY